MPVAAEVRLLLLGLHHLEDIGEALEAGDEGVVAGLAELRADPHDVRRLEALVAEHQHRVLEECALDLVPAGLVQTRQVDAMDLGTQRPG